MDTIIANVCATVVGVVSVQMTERGHVHVERKVSYHCDVVMASLTEYFLVRVHVSLHGRSSNVW